MRRLRHQRRGVALLVTLVCIVLLGFLIVTVLRFALSRRKEIVMQMERAQASCLADSGLRLATVRLQSDPDYSGETWEILPETLGSKHGATVVIEVKPTDNENQRQVEVTADYPKDIMKRTRIHKQITVKFNRSADAE